MKTKCLSGLLLLMLFAVLCLSSCIPYRTTSFDQWDTFFVDNQIHSVAKEKLELKIPTIDNPKTLSKGLYITHLIFSPGNASLLSYERFDMPDSMFMYNFADDSFLYMNYPSGQGDSFIIYNFRTRKYTQKDGIVKKLRSSPLFHIEINRDGRGHIYRGDSMVAELPLVHGRNPRTAIGYFPEKQMVVYMDCFMSKAPRYKKYSEPTICRIYEHALTDDTVSTLKYEFKFAQRVRPSYHSRENDSPLIVFSTTLEDQNMFFSGSKLAACKKLPPFFNILYSICINDIFYELSQWPRIYSMKTNELIDYYELYVSFFGTLKAKANGLKRESEDCKSFDFLPQNFEGESTDEWEQIYY